MLIFVLAVATALVVSFLCSIFESVLLSVGIAQVESLRKSGRPAGRILDRFKREMDVPIAAILILNTLAHTVGASVAGATYGEVFDPSTLWIFSLVFTVAILVFTEIIPKTLGVSFNRALAAPVALMVQFLVVALKPALVLTRAMSRLLRPDEEPPVTSIEEIRLLAALGRAEGVLGPKAADIIEGAGQLRDLTAADIMMPRNRVTFLSADRTLEENLDVVRTSGHSRFPFTPGKDLDQVKGMVLAKELFFHARDHDDIDWDAIMQPADFVPETTRLYSLLRMFQHERRHLAVVVDEYGGFSGIVTLEDVLEEIVGEIWDETDREHAGITNRPDGGWTCLGFAETRKVFEVLGIEAKTEAVTLSGFLAEKLGAVPTRGDTVHTDGFRFRVSKASPRRAERIDIEAPPPEND